METGGGNEPCGIKCPRCSMRIPSPPGEGQHLLIACPHCHVKLRAIPFPALHRQRTGTRATDKLSEQESGCFYHAGKQAEALCDHCGRFLCALCQVPWHKQTLCPDCITLGRKRGTSRHNLSNIRTRYDAQVLSWGVLPLLIPPFWWIMWLTAPYVLITAIRHRHTPCSFLPNRHQGIRFAVGSFFAICQIIASIAFLLSMRFLGIFH